MITLSLTFPSLSLSSFQPLSSIATRSRSCFSLYIFKTNHYKPKPHPPSSSSSSSFVNSNKTNKDDEFLLDDELISRVSASRDADVAMEAIVAEIGGGGVVSGSDCCLIISKAFESGNVGLALSVGNAMRSSFGSGASGDGMVSSVQRWRWSRPDVDTYTILVLGLAASLRVSDALKMIGAVSRVGVSPGEEVPFGQIVKCPTCLIAVAVAQPQHGIQIVSCSKCRYQYELVSGDITSIESEEISMEAPAWKRGLSFVLRRRQNLPAAVHSIVVNTPSGTGRTHRFATETVDLPAQEGERVTIAVAATSNMYRQVGPLKISPKSPNFYPGEPIFLTNHINGRESLLLRAPIKNENSSLLNPSIIIPLVAVLATGDAASGMIDPSLPQLISVAAFSTLAIGATFKSLVVPQLARLPQKSVDAIAIRQQLLSQYDQLQSRIKDLKEAAQNEVWMLARMCQLENKIFAVGEPSYRARKSRVRKVRENLEGSLKKRIELIDSYAKISSMIEIEVEMDSDVLGAEAASNAESIADQIQQTMELENLEERWKIQIEANDEVERLLRSELTSSEQVMDV